ncbi:hypothetical protein ABZV81_35955 [Streptomyces parvus]|uniref:hypothetical protein n=1 Tax=Streptomyces parvus TaxID=66428 RepID=UPI002101406D|nr:hypothetical protein [Streptomyces parvus]MCQ1581240.1 hypothetical protein [Streptomyces parvus]
MSTLTASRNSAMAAGGQILDRLLPALGPGLHLLSVRVEAITGQVVPGRVLINVADECGIVVMEPAQRDAFSTVLGAGMQMFGSSVTVELHSPAPGRRTRTVARMWEKGDWSSDLAALTAEECASRHSGSSATRYGQAFALTA